jgi:hypothetical protein
VPIATTPEQRALQDSLRDWAKRVDTIAAVRARQDPTALMSDLAALGVFAIPREGTVSDLAAALEQLAWALAPGPILPTALAALLGQDAACVALDPLTPGTLRTNDALKISGETGPVLWAEGHLLASTQDGAWFLLNQDQPGVTVTKLTPLDFSRELATIRLDDVTPDKLLPGLRTDGVRDLAATLYAAEAAGVAAWCSATAADYAKIRHQFDRPIGAFQAVKHLCATMACRAERAAALAWGAARAADQTRAEHPLAAAAAAALALDDAVDNAKDCIQVLGGIGFTWEHDAHLYLRRALALRQLLGGSPGWRTRAAQLARGVWGDGIPPKGGLGGWVPPGAGGYGGVVPPASRAGGMGRVVPPASRERNGFGWDLGLAVPGLAGLVLPAGRPAAPLAGVLRESVRHGREQWDLLPAAAAGDLRRLAGASRRRLRDDGQGQPLSQPRAAAARSGRAGAQAARRGSRAR